uniref:Uncharacterized protein n=1 Tax=Periophthalmus magnuspinnatus TaxID=409849 RepID=A0A3B4AS13_9GOBI
MVPPPRLTGALRSFSGLCKTEDPTEKPVDVKAKRLKRQELFAKEGLTWKKIVSFCSEHEELRTVLQAAKQIGNYPLFRQDSVQRTLDAPM